MTKPSFNLMTEPWLVLRDLRGEVKQLSLRDTLVHAHELEDLQDPSPLVLGALPRLLMAVLHRALGGPASTAEAFDLLEAGRFDATAIDAYADAWQHRFDLFDHEAPFYQVPDWALPEEKRSTVARLAPELASGNNTLWFDHTLDDAPPPISAAEAARWLVMNQTFALGGGNSAFRYLSHAPVATCAVARALGTTLFETLLLNLVPVSKQAQNRDAPVWEAEPLRARDLADPARSKRIPRGLTDRFTWPSRAVRLHPEPTEHGIGVRWISYASGVTPDLDGKSVAGFPDDPMVAYRDDPKRGALPQSFREGRAFWRDFHALLPKPTGSGSRMPQSLAHAAELRAEQGDFGLLPVQVVGQANKQAKVLMWRAESYPVPVRLLRDPSTAETVERALVLANDVARQALRGAGRRLASELLTTTSDRSADQDAIYAMVDGFPLETTYWSRLEQAFPAALAAFAPDPTAALDAWKDTLRREARLAWRDTINSIGRRAATFRAASLAERTLEFKLRQLLDDASQQKGVA